MSSSHSDLKVFDLRLPHTDLEVTYVPQTRQSAPHHPTSLLAELGLAFETAAPCRLKCVAEMA